MLCRKEDQNSANFRYRKCVIFPSEPTVKLDTVGCDSEEKTQRPIRRNTFNHLSLFIMKVTTEFPKSKGALLSSE